MVIPAGAFKFSVVMDPAERIDYQIRLKDAGKELLEAAESIDTYTLTLYPEAIALGLNILTAGAYAPFEDGSNITFWLDVDEGFKQDAAYDGNGATLAMELTVITDNNPARTRQRTLTVGVAQL